MFKNNIKIAFRNLLKDKVFSFINIIGLSVGMAAFLLIVHYVQFEHNYDNFIEQGKDIYRVSLNQYHNNELVTSTTENYPGVGPALLQEIPEVIGFARLSNMGYKNKIIISYEDAPAGPKQFRQRKFLYADSSFLAMFGYPMKLGDATTALAEPFSVVISEKCAKMYFGDENPLGKSLRLQDDDSNDETCIVTGVFKDLPANTHLSFDLLFSYKTLFSRRNRAPGYYNQTWKRQMMYTYIKVIPGTDPLKLAEKFPDLIAKYKPGLAAANKYDELILQQLGDIHLYSNLAEEPGINGDARAVYFLGIIGIFILLIAWINYINLSTSKAMERANEVGVRKAMGAFKNQLIGQFLSESAIINFFAILLTIAIIIIALPTFNNLTGMAITAKSLFSIWFILSIPVLWVVGTLLSGIYPAFVISSFLPITVLRGKLSSSKGGVLLRKGLVIFQFIASVFLIAGTAIVYQQLKYLKNQDLGVNIDKVLVVESPGITSSDKSYVASVDGFKNALLDNPDVKAVAMSVTIPGRKREYNVGAKQYSHTDDKIVTLRFNSMDNSFIDVYGMELIAGRTFSDEYVNEIESSIILGKLSAKLLGFETPNDAIGKKISLSQYNWHPVVIGVVNDYNQESLKKDKDPMIFYYSRYSGEYYSIKLNTGNYQDVIEHTEASWHKAFAGNPFEYFFLDDYFNMQYENDRKFGNIFAVFAIIAIIVGCLGLFGLSAFTVQQRTKEIGVRKVLGSSVVGIVILLSKDFAKLVLIACIIGLPLVYYFMNNWLEGFATRMNIDVFLLIGSGLIVLTFALITVSYQTFKAAVVNPTNSLKYE